MNLKDYLVGRGEVGWGALPPSSSDSYAYVLDGIKVQLTETVVQ